VQRAPPQAIHPDRPWRDSREEYYFLNNPHTHNPGTGDTRTLSTTGFIYSTYWAAGKEDPIDKAITKASKQRNAHLCSAVGGSLSTLSFTGTRVEEVRTWRKATSYAERYLAKKEEFPEGSETGGIWGLWNYELLPVQWESVRVSLRDAYKIRRVYRRLARLKGTSSLRRLTVFVRYENVIRLLEFLGVPP
jgi:hypothetical protein